MQTTGIFTTHRFPVEFDAYGDTIPLFPFGDIHRFAFLCDEAKWLEDLEEMSRHPKALFLGMGDYDDLASTSERRILGSPDLHDTSQKTIQHVYLERTMKFAKEIEFMRGRIIGLIEGNHYGIFPNGMTTTQKLAEMLGCRYLGVSSVIRLAFINRSRRGRRNTALDVFAHHGLGASRLIGGSLNKVQQMVEGVEADIHLMGHDHQRGGAFRERLKLHDANGVLKLVRRKVFFGRTGSYLRGYVENEASYVADKGLPPTSLGGIRLDLTPRRIRRNIEGKTRDIDTFVDIRHYQ